MANRISHSNYTIQKKRQLTERGGIYERDWSTVTEFGWYAPGSMPIYSSGNFKLTINPDRGGRRKYSFSNWVVTDSGSTDWTLSDIKEEIVLTPVMIKPNYSSILDFAYYGSAVELVRGTINDLSEKYPGEIFTANMSATYLDKSTDTVKTIIGLVENPFKIDVSSKVIKESDVRNKYRYMCLSYDKYEIITGTGPETDYPVTGYPVTGWSAGTTIRRDCPLNGDVMFSGATISSSRETLRFDGIWMNGEIVLVCRTVGKHVRLQKKYIDECFDAFDDFERTLLNLDTIPKFKARFFTPTETERGVVTREVPYIWPTLPGGWNLDFQTDAFASYLNGLLKLAGYYDEIRTDNIWRSYTHESIKNFDWTTPRDTYIPEIEGKLIDTERLEAILKVCGRQFDDLKRFIENIKYTVNVSYDSKNNMPDYLLPKFLDMAGWEVKDTSPVNDETISQDVIYPGKHVRATSSDANSEFLRRMILNSRNILSKKGTRAGIEAVYSMFGIFNMRHGETMRYRGRNETVGFDIDERDVFTRGYISGSAVDNVTKLNIEKDGYDEQHESTLSYFCGLMCEERFTIDGRQFLVPWYDMSERYDGWAYYQMMGGWGKRARKRIETDIAPSVAEITSGTNFSIYDETVKNVRVAESFEELNETPVGYLEIGDVYYVLNLAAAYNIHGCSEANDSHYVFLTGNTSFPRTVPYNDTLSWCLVSSDDFTKNPMPWYARKILYMESIHDNAFGNNPHNGNVEYDDGEEYFEYYKKIFKGAFDDDLFRTYREGVATENGRRHYENRFRTQKLPDVPDLTSTVSGVGFSLTSATDNSKIWYFLNDDIDIYQASGRRLGKRLFGSSGGFTKIKPSDFPLQSEAITNTWNKPITSKTPTAVSVWRPSETLAIQSGVKAIHTNGPDETWSYSVVNTKTLKITYHLPWEMEDYVTDVIEPFVKQVIPSTAILEFDWVYSGGQTRPAAKPRYASINLNPSWQSIRAGDTTAEIGIETINVTGVGIDSESTERR